MRSRKFLACAGVCFLACLASAPAPAQLFGGVQIQGIEVAKIIRPLGKHRPFEGRIGGDDTAFSQQRLCAEFLKNRAAFETRVRDSFRNLAQPRLRPFGLGTHSQTSASLSSNCTARAEYFSVNGGQITITAIFTGNQLNVRLTTPPGIPGGLDPRFVIRFDAEARIVISVPTQTSGRLTVTDSQVATMNASRAAAGNITGSIVIAANALVALITGSDFRDSLRQNGVFHPSISVPLDQINGVLARAPGFRIEHRFQGQNLRLFLTKEPEAPGPIVH